MNKDKIGLIKYIALVMTISILTMLEGLLFLLLAIAGIELKDGDYVHAIVLISFFIIPFLYIISLVLITRCAIKHHWSKYLETFFNDIKCNTLMLFLSFLIIYSFKFDFVDGGIGYYVCFGLAPSYIIIYVTNLCILLKNFIKNKRC